MQIQHPRDIQAKDLLVEQLLESVCQFLSTPASTECDHKPGVQLRAALTTFGRNSEYDLYYLSSLSG